MSKKHQEQLWFWTKIVFFALIAGGFIRFFLLLPLQIEGTSMAPTLHQKDFVLAEKITAIKRFDVIIFHRSDGTTYVKRVIGLPGDRLRYKDDQLYINGKKVAEPFLKANKAKITADSQLTNDFTYKESNGDTRIPANHYFVMGDNRRLSKDSRSFGLVSHAEVFAKVRLIYYPFSDFGNV